jgi:hypothetical protein
MADQRMKEYKISSFADIVQALRENPKWLKELRRMILTQELLRLPTKLAEFRNEIKEDLASLQDSRFLKGLCLEMRVLDNVSSFFSEHLLDAKVVGQEEIKQSLSVAMGKGVISKEEMEELCRLDLIVEGGLPSTKEPVLLAVEVSCMIDRNDVERAVRRAEILKRAMGRNVFPAVVGHRISKRAKKLATKTGCLKILVPE